MICYNYINDYIRSTIRKESGILKELREYADNNHVPIIHPEVTALLEVIGNLHRPERILEIGTAIGYSAILMAGFLKTGGRIDTIERHDLMVNAAKENIKKAELSNVISIIEGDALEILKYYDKKYDMIFLDAAKGQYPEFLPECIRMLNPGGLLVSDNVLYKGMVACDELIVHRKKTIVKRMRSFLDSICNDSRLKTSLIPIGDGVALSWLKD